MEQQKIVDIPDVVEAREIKEIVTVRDSVTKQIVRYIVETADGMKW